VTTDFASIHKNHLLVRGNVKQQPEPEADAAFGEKKMFHLGEGLRVEISKELSLPSLPPVRRDLTCKNASRRTTKLPDSRAESTPPPYRLSLPCQPSGRVAALPGALTPRSASARNACKTSPERRTDGPRAVRRRWDSSSGYSRSSRLRSDGGVPSFPPVAQNSCWELQSPSKKNPLDTLDSHVSCPQLFGKANTKLTSVAGAAGSDEFR
jgi:hypothetical protein